MDFQRPVSPARFQAAVKMHSKTVYNCVVFDHEVVEHRESIRYM
jgi:hypothetical protein